MQCITQVMMAAGGALPSKVYEYYTYDSGTTSMMDDVYKDSR